jgi:hypothetical protein
VHSDVGSHVLVACFACLPFVAFLHFAMFSLIPAFIPFFPSRSNVAFADEATQNNRVFAASAASSDARRGWRPPLSALRPGRCCRCRCCWCWFWGLWLWLLSLLLSLILLSTERHHGTEKLTAPMLCDGSAMSRCRHRRTDEIVFSTQVCNMLMRKKANLS